MPSYNAIKWRDNVTPRLRLLQPNTLAALDTGVTDSMSRSVKAIRTQVIKAKTKTGIRRAAGLPPLYKPRPAWYLGNGPGRVESGAMLASARWTTTVGPTGVTGRAGFINAPRYTALQELGSPGKGGVPAMLAYAKGHTVMEARFAPTMNRFMERAIRYAQSGQVLQSQVGP